VTNINEGGGGPMYLSGRGALARGSLSSARTAKSVSKQSLLDLVGNRLGVAGCLSLGVSPFISQLVDFRTSDMNSVLECRLRCWREWWG